MDCLTSMKELLRVHSPRKPMIAAQQGLAAMALLAVAGFALWTVQQPAWMAIGALGAIFALIVLVMRPNTGTLLFLALAYVNAPVLLGRVIGSPQIVGAGLTVLIGIPILVYVFKRQGVVLDYGFALMLMFLCALCGSTLVSVDAGIAVAWVVEFVVEGMLIYFLILNAIRNLPTLRGAVWTLMIAATLLSAMSVYQEVTGSYRQQFGGLAQRNTERDDVDAAAARDRENVSVSNRAGGPTGGPNRYAQILMFVLPLAFFRARDASRRGLRLLAVGCLLMILAGIFLTYSRGGFMTLVVLTVMMIALKYIRWQHVIVGGLLVGGLVTIVAPGFLVRIETIREIPSLLTNRDVVTGHGAIRGRLTETLAAMNVFLDHPVVGVGPGQFTPFYSVDYMENPDIAFRSIDKNRRSHCLYAELAAETGLLGFALFLTIAGMITVRLWRQRARFLSRDPELANLATSIWFGIMAYLGTAWFLQLSYQRYMWTFFALGAAAVQILKSIQDVRVQPQPQPAEEAEPPKLEAAA